MSIMNMAVYIFIENILQGIFWMLIVNSMLHEKRYTLIRYLLKLAIISFGIVVLVVLNHNHSFFRFSDIIFMMFMTFLIALALSYNHFLLKKMLFCTSAISTIMLVLILFKFKEITNSLVISLWLITIIYAICMIAQNIRSRFDWNLNYSEFCVVVVIIVSFIYSVFKLWIYYGKNMSVEWNYIEIWVCGLLCINVLFYYIVGSIYELYEKRLETRLMELSYESSEYSAEKIMHMYEEASKIRHDMKNCMMIVDKCIEQGDYSEARKYISTLMEEKIDVLGIKMFCSNKVLNYIINNKFAVCDKMNIETKCIISANLNEISAVDLSILIGNLLDNAMEAAEKTEWRMVNIEIYEEENITIIVENTINESVLQNNHMFATTKLDKSKHGYGMISIKDILKKYRGSIEYTEDGNVLTCQVVLKNNGKKQ